MESTQELRIVPLGGLGEIGMNCLALEQGGDIVVIDCGVTFPTGDTGVDVIHPRFDYLLERRGRIGGIVITHGHEDHIGALPYLLDQIDAPVYAPEHALTLIRARLEEHRFDLGGLRLSRVNVGDRFSVGSFEIEPIRVTHSIADATALAISTAVGTVVHTGDFKLDEHPSDGERTDEARLRALGDAGVRLLLSDSTNVDSPGTSASERVVEAELEEIVGAANGRVVIGIFASNVQRLISIGGIARRAGRKVVLLGRSVGNHVRAATEVGRLAWPSDLVVSPENAQRLPRRELLVIASGTQAEPLAALARLAAGTHPNLALEKGDTVTFSSRVIPGNDRAVFDMYAAFLRRGLEVASRITHPRVHASGHAHRDEQKRMIELCRPEAFVPLHGTLHHLTRHAELARSCDVADVLVAENGDVVVVATDRPLAKIGRVVTGRVATSGGDPLADEVLRERAQLARAGVISVTVALDARGRALGKPIVKAMGVIGPLDVDVLALAERAVLAALERGLGSAATPEALASTLKLAARRAIEADTGQKPHVLVSVLRSST